MALLTSHKMSVNLETIKDMDEEGYKGLLSYFGQWDDDKSREDVRLIELARNEAVEDEEPKAAAKKTSK